MKICVIGAGVVGLNTAIALFKEYPNADITILADKFTTETVSDVAAGLFRPSSSFSGPTDEITRYSCLNERQNNIILSMSSNPLFASHVIKTIGRDTET